ncbi:MAG: hypothetical protein QUS14_18430 [Pyrinomonadaceae bacterium]|nr:hypothetical protein [Pyrinomonadaceae bacterium]
MHSKYLKDPLTLIRSTFLVGFVSMGQVIAFMFLYSAAAEIYTIAYGPIKGDLAYGIGLHHSLYLLGVLSAANAVVQIFADSRGTRWLATVNTSLLWLFFWADILPEMPNRFLLVSVAGITTFLITMLFFYRIPAKYAVEGSVEVI